jgi:hypothetical protein
MVVLLNNARVCVFLMCGAVGAMAFRSSSIRCGVKTALQQQRNYGQNKLSSTYVTRHSGSNMAPLFAKDNTSEEGVQTKYLVALGVFFFAALYDYFITHQGMKDGWVI